MEESQRRRLRSESFALNGQRRGSRRSTLCETTPAALATEETTTTSTAATPQTEAGMGAFIVFLTL